jgi:hypothetical protein
VLYCLIIEASAVRRCDTATSPVFAIIGGAIFSRPVGKRLGQPR